MTKRPNLSSMVIRYDVEPISKIVGVITVTSRNEHGFLIKMEHFDEASARRERAQRAMQGHTDIQ